MPIKKPGNRIDAKANAKMIESQVLKAVRNA